MSIYYTLAICSSRAWEAYAMPSLHAVSVLAAHLAYPHYMQSWSLQGIGHTTITCRPRLHRAHAMPSLSAISELVKHMPCPQLLLCIASYYVLILYITSYLIAPWALHALWALNLKASKTCTTSSSQAILYIWWEYAMPSLHAVLELARHMPCHHACNFWACVTCAMPSLHAVPELV